MSLQSFYKSIPSGFPGDIVPVVGTLVESGKFRPDSPPAIPGIPVKVDAEGYMSPLEEDDPVTSIYGIFGRFVPKIGESLASTFGNDPVKKSYLQGILVWGYEKILVAGSAVPMRGQPVYVRNLSGVSSYPIGTFAAAALDATFSQVPNIIWAEIGTDDYGIGVVRFASLISGANTSGGVAAGRAIEVTPAPGVQTVSVAATEFMAALFLMNDAAEVRAALGLGTLSTQNADSISVTGGTLSDVTLTNTTINP